MTSWVYVFSRFTPEALLFEALLICVLLSGYAGFWVLYKRKMGAIEQAVPTGVVKNYLNELIVDAERMRAQLFGLLAAKEAGTFDPSQYQNVQNPAPVDIDAALAQKLAQMEAKLAEQSAVIQSVQNEKSQLEQALAAAKSSQPTAGAGADPALLAELQAKLKNLEGKLAEYSVIEDDLANLKRLQQENAALKSALEGKGIAAASVVAAPGPTPTVAPTPAPAAPAQAPTPAASAALPAQGKVEQGAIDALFQKTDSNDAFEGLVDQVEKSLQGEAPAAAAPTPAPVPVAAAPAPAPTPAPAPAAATPAPSTSAAAPVSMDKSDADLVAEFEKMLNG